jgi:hypothetical protein
VIPGSLGICLSFDSPVRPRDNFASARGLIGARPRFEWLVRGLPDVNAWLEEMQRESERAYDAVWPESPAIRVVDINGPGESGLDNHQWDHLL